MREGHTKVAKLIRDKGGELMWDEGKESGELCELARAGDLERVQLLLDSGCNANAADYDKRTCLHLACSVGNLRIVEVLRQHGADVNFKDRSETSSHLASP
jgi:ankyrin repeat protein